MWLAENGNRFTYFYVYIHTYICKCVYRNAHTHSYRYGKETHTNTKNALHLIINYTILIYSDKKGGNNKAQQCGTLWNWNYETEATPTTSIKHTLKRARGRERETQSPLFALRVWVSRLRVIWMELKLNSWIHSSVKPFFTTAVAVAVSVDFDTV